MTSLASQVAVELVDNQGNLSKNLRALGSSETVKATATAMAIGGALAGFDQVLDANVPADKARLPALIKDEGWSKIVQRVAEQLVISSSLNTATNGGSFKDNLTNALLINLGNQINAEGANLIGDNGDILGLPGKAVSHAVLAGISAEIGRGDGKGAAAGALTTHTPEGTYSAADSAQSVYRYNMTDHMFMPFALDNQRDILAAGNGDTEAAKRVAARREGAAAIAVIGGGIVLTAGGLTLLGAAPELVAAARLIITGCKTNPALCLNLAGIYAADIAAPNAVIGTGAIASGSTLVVGKTADAAKTLAQQTVKTVDESLKSRVFNTQPVADLVKAQTATDARLSAQTAEKLQALQKTSTDQLVKVFDPKQSESKLSVFGQQFEQVLGEGGGNKSGTTKVFATEKLSRQEIIDYAQSLAGAVPLEEKKTPKGMVYFAKKDGVTINLREYSDSKEQTKARWTIDIVGKSSVGDAVGQKVKKVEIKFR
jgi:filamentous hemagglutinin